MNALFVEDASIVTRYRSIQRETAYNPSFLFFSDLFPGITSKLRLRNNTPKSNGPCPIVRIVHHQILVVLVDLFGVGVVPPTP